MSKTIAIQIRTLEVTANAVAVINKGIDKVQRALHTGIDKAQSAVVNALNQRLDWMAYEYLGQAATVLQAPYKQAELLSEKRDALTAKFVEDGVQRRAAYSEASTNLIDKQAECTSLESLDKAQAKVAAIYKARVELLARKR